MERIILRDQNLIAPFAEPARDLRLLNNPLWLLQRDLLKSFCQGSREIQSIADLSALVQHNDQELLVHRDNLFFNRPLIESFISEARASRKACQIAFRARRGPGHPGDPSIEQHAVELCDGIRRYEDVTYLDGGTVQSGPVYVADLYYIPPGCNDQPVPIIIDTLSHEMGYYRIPSYMAQQGDLTYQIPLRAFLSIEHWVHVFMANILMGVFSLAAEQDVRMDQARLQDLLHWSRKDWALFPKKIAFSLAALRQRLNPFKEPWRNHFLASPELVKVGKQCSIDPSATIHGPTVIGDNVYIGPGVVIANSLIGNNVNIMQGSQIMLSVISDRCFLPFNAGLFMSSLMENSMVAQNATLQLSVVGRNSFIGANSCFTDFNLQGEAIKVLHHGQLVPVNLPILGSAVGHHVKIGSGFVIYPGRLIESHSTLIFCDKESVIRHTVVGHGSEDIDPVCGEPRQIVYHWPHIATEEAP